MSWDDLKGWDAHPTPKELPPFTDDEIAVYEAIDGLWHAALRAGHRWVTPDELHRACPRFTRRALGHHMVWLHLQHLIVWDIEVGTLETLGVAPSELPPPWRRGRD